MDSYRPIESLPLVSIAARKATLYQLLDNKAGGIKPTTDGRTGTSVHSKLTSGDDGDNLDQSCTSTICRRSSDGLYQPYHDYAWNKLREISQVIQIMEQDIVPPDLKWSCTPSSASSSSSSSSTTTTNIYVEGFKYFLHPQDTMTIPHSASGIPESSPPSPLYYARSALLETTATIPILPHESNYAATISAKNTSPGIHVLNFVIFPNTNYDIPIFGADIVSLPGNRHLVAIDLQPVRVRAPSSSSPSATTTSKQEEECTKEVDEGVLNLSKDHLVRLTQLHAKYVQKFPWGGDIPKAAQRFFSPYALWTRLIPDPGRDNDCDPIHVLQTDLFCCFQEYLDLYGDIVIEAATQQDHINHYYCPESRNSLERGQSDYIRYRYINDPARPLLKRLFGEEWSERLLSEVLFQQIAS
jgi:phycoerythrobilin:ferredoxin oxidoreductase